MTKFEQIGVNYQYDSCSKEEAARALRHSCRCCCERGMQITCSRCAIEQAHNLVVAAFDSKTMAQEVNI